MADLIKPAAVDAYNADVVGDKTGAIAALTAILGAAVPKASLSVVYTDRANRLLVVTDGTTHLAAKLRDGSWHVSLVRFQDGQWTLVKEVHSLVELGEALA